MSKESAIRFLKELRTNEKARELLQGLKIPESKEDKIKVCAKIAADLGEDVRAGVIEFHARHRLAPQRSRSVWAPRVAAGVKNEVKGEERRDQNRKNSPDPLVLDDPVEMMNNHFLLPVFSCC